ncbi:YcjF family protein [Tropicimonas sp. IMCC34011]|uniref:YcjF family protein n=1 Tax=Tropicimonas sp. IMCC34011 TaxID=2248759 RepID=UPI000E27EE26|nr:TIGR01620 family protein [Tropicimonas sp. IMCC34011]
MSDETARPGRRPVMIEIDAETRGAPGMSPAEAPPVPDAPRSEAPRGQAMKTLAALGARRSSGAAKLFWGALVSLIGFAASVAAWSFVTSLLQANPVLGIIAAGLVSAVLLALIAMAIKEAASFWRLGRLDHIHRDAEAALAGADLSLARKSVASLEKLYASRSDLEWGRARLAERKGDLFDADALLGLAEAELMGQLDLAARAEIEAAARQVAAVTAVVPLALADVFTALTSNLRMIRRIAEIYGGRSGTLGTWRLTRSVLTHLVATGAVAVGDDLIHTVAGGGLLSRLSRRFGEGVVNGALTARVGVAAMEVCRPLPFQRLRKPTTANLVGRALTGLFDKDED